MNRTQEHYQDNKEPKGTPSSQGGTFHAVGNYRIKTSNEGGMGQHKRRKFADERQAQTKEESLNQAPPLKAPLPPEPPPQPPR